MALFLPRTRTLLLLVPKTGSTWIRDVIGRAGIEFVPVGDPEMRAHDTLTQFRRSDYRFISCFVRNPIDWYRSYWAYRMERGWRPQYRIDELCRNDDFTTFVRNVTTVMPGALSNIFQSYAGPADAPVDFIGHQERLADDLVELLTRVGEMFDADLIRRAGLVNATCMRPDYPEELKELITLSEWDTMERFGYLAGRPDPIGLAAMRARYPEDANHLRLLALWTEKIHWESDDAKVKAGQPIRPETRYARAHSNFALFAQHKRQDPDTADSLYRKALELDPRHPRTLCNYALFQLGCRNNVKEAECLMLTALRSRPNHPYTLGKYGRLQYRQYRNANLAEVLLRQSLTANPRQPDVMVDLAQLLAEERGEFDESEALYEAALKESPGDVRANLALADFLERHRGAPEAATRIYKGMPVGADDVPLLAGRFGALARSGLNPAGAEALLQRAEELAPGAFHPCQSGPAAHRPGRERSLTPS